MDPKIKVLMDDANTARNLYRSGAITREDCNARIAPYAEAYNKRAKELAKEFGVRFKPFSTAAYLR